MRIKNAVYTISSPDYEKCPSPDRPEYAFIGRSNVGKSSLINMICQNEKLAKISNSPGKTQMINHFEITSVSSGTHSERKWYLVDLPGYGFAKVSQSSRRRWEQMIENYLRKRGNLLQVFVLVDSRHTPENRPGFFTKTAGLGNPGNPCLHQNRQGKPGHGGQTYFPYAGKPEKDPPFFAPSHRDQLSKRNREGQDP